MRNRQVVRQWTLLRRLARSRGNTLRTLSNELGVAGRTIRRDLDALQEAGFPLVDEIADDRGTVQWRLLGDRELDGGAR